MKNKVFLFFLLVFANNLHGQNPLFKIAKVKYKGGGDWYANKTSLPNLIQFANQQKKMGIDPTPETVELTSPLLWNYPSLHLTGHGNVLFDKEEQKNLRKYLLGGGFLHIDDNYGLDKSIRREMAKVFPELSFIELPFTHPIYSQAYPFPKGLPKVHEHDGKAPQGFGLIYQGRLICFYSYECDLGNGWEDESIYHDPAEKREAALKMGVNILQYAFLNP
ncbi:DUF4159 domain-containing protein [Aquirufa sp. OSTEICH-129A]